MQTMANAVPAAVAAKADTAKLVGRGVSALVVLFMLFDGGTKLIAEQHVVTAMAELGWPSSQTVGLGLVILACTALYTVPRTAFLGAILLTGFLGGATAAKVRLDGTAFGFSVAMGVLVWLGLYLRDARLRELVPFRKGA
jgi:hypothetical protein